MFDYIDIYQAYKRCVKRKKDTINAQHFEANLIENLYNLEISLNNGSYKPKRFICFLTTSPKLREVFAPDFSDRVLHHLIVPILERLYEPTFIYDSYSNRKGKGIHLATKRAQKFMRGSKYYLQLDVKSFFYTINKDILFLKIKKFLIYKNKRLNEAKAVVSEEKCIGCEALASPLNDKKGYGIKNKRLNEAKAVVSEEKYIGCEALASPKIEIDKLLKVIHTIIWHDITKDIIFKGDPKAIANLPSHKSLLKAPKNIGLPIGNLTSQFFANVYMNDFDNFIKRKLKVKRYLRYVDDFVLFADTKEELMEYYQEIVNYLDKELKLKLRDRYILKNNNDGLDFLGYIIRPYYKLTRKRVVNNYKYKKAKYLDEYERQKGKMSLEEIKKFLSVQASFEGHIKHSNSFNLYNKVGKINESNPFDFDRA